MAENSIPELRERYGPRYPWYALLSVVLANLAVTVPTMIIYVALPDMMQAFDVSEARIQWLVTGLQVASTVSMIATIWLVRRVGQRRAYVLASLVFVAGALLGGVPKFEVAILGRVLQGIGCGLLPAISMVTIVTVLAPRQLGLGMSIWGTSFAVTAAITPYVGGVLVERLGWPSTSFAVIPLLLVGIVLGWLFLPGRDRDERAQPFDWPGIALLSAAIGTFLYLPALGGSAGWGSRPFVACALASAAAFAALIAWQLRASHPLFELSLFSNRRFSAAFVIALGYDFGMYGTMFLVPLFAQTVIGYSPSLSGSLLLPGGIAYIIVMMIAGPLCNRWSSQAIVVTGLIAFTLSCALLTATTPSSTFAFLALCLVLSRAGTAILLPALSVFTVRVTEPAQHASASVHVNFARIFGGAIGSFALAIFYDWRSTLHQLEQGLAPSRDATALSGELLARWQEAKTLAVQESFWLMTIVFLLTLVPALLVREPPPSAAGSAAREPRTGRA